MGTIATTTETTGGGDYRWLSSSRGTAHPKSGTADISEFVEADDYPDGYLPSGLPVTIDGVTGQLEACASSDTADTVAGFVLHDTPVPVGAAAVSVAYITDATIVASFVPGDHDLTDGRYITDEVTGGAS
jgi:hypothetical protein